LLFFEGVCDGGEAEGKGWVVGAVEAAEGVFGLGRFALGEEVDGGSASVSSLRFVM
jgi:hypothetical protein